MKEFNRLSTYTMLAAVMLGLVLPKIKMPDALAQSTASVQPNTLVTKSSDIGTPRLLKLELSVSQPKDLKVKQGESIAAGDIIADRVDERAKLDVQRKELQLSLTQIEARQVPTPPTLKSVPGVKSLPPVSYAEERAAIEKAQIKVLEETAALDLQKRSLSVAPPQETAALEDARAKTQVAQRALEIQQRKIDAISQMELPEAVGEHEAQVLEQRQIEVQQAEAQERMAQAKLEAASLSAAEKERSLSASLQDAKSGLSVAQAQLKSAEDRRNYQEYEHSLALAKRVEEENQANQSYSRQVMETESQKRDKDFQIAQVKGRIQEVENKLAQLSTVKSPYSGQVRRIKYAGQKDKDLLVEVTLVVNGGVATDQPGN